ARGFADDRIDRGGISEFSAGSSAVARARDRRRRGPRDGRGPPGGAYARGDAGRRLDRRSALGASLWREARPAGGRAGPLPRWGPDLSDPDFAGDESLPRRVPMARPGPRISTRPPGSEDRFGRGQ